MSPSNYFSTRKHVGLRLFPVVLALALFVAGEKKMMAQAPPVLTKTFSSVAVPPNQAVWVVFTVTNPNPATTLTAVGFIDPLPAGLRVTTPSQVVGTCGGGVI